MIKIFEEIDLEIFFAGLKLFRRQKKLHKNNL